MGAAMPWIDWDEATRVGVELVPPGPRASHSERLEVVADLRAAAARSTAIITRATRLPEVGEARELVVDRRTLVSANLDTARTLLAPFVPAEPEGPLSAAAGKVRGSAIGAVLAVMGGRILGQFDPFGAEPTLLLSAPTVMSIERSLNVVPADFRMWVALHEQTHRVQFANAPWLREHLLAQVHTMVEAEEQGSPLWSELGRRLERIRRDRDEGRALSLRLLDAVSAPETVAAMDRVTSAMSLLEGHADFMMDRASRRVVPTMPTIRAKFNQRRGRGGWWGLLNRLLGMDAKLAQYSDGAAFCRYVVKHADLETLNVAFTAADQLPSLDELLHPERWLARVG